MFEKEAEEYAEKNTGTISLPIHEAYARGLEEGFQDGAEFGYNKANEWHKVSEVGLPKNDNTPKTFLLWTTYGKGGSPVVASFRYRNEDVLENVWNGRVFEPSEIVEWKECDLPKGVE